MFSRALRRILQFGSDTVNRAVPYEVPSVRIYETTGAQKVRSIRARNAFVLHVGQGTVVKRARHSGTLHGLRAIPKPYAMLLSARHRSFEHSDGSIVFGPVVGQEQSMPPSILTRGLNGSGAVPGKIQNTMSRDELERGPEFIRQCSPVVFAKNGVQASPPRSRNKSSNIAASSPHLM